MAAAVQSKNPSERKPLTVDRLRELVSYDPETGVMVRVVAVPRGPVGSVVGTKNSHGHLVARIDFHIYYVHRLAWLYMTGEWPASCVDHRNLDRSDNRWSNLRAASYAENKWNAPRMKTNTSGVKGVHWFKQYGRWRSTIRAQGREHFLGYFDSKEEAEAARAEAAKKLHGDFARLA